MCVHVCRYESLLRGVSDPVAFFRDSTADAEEEGGRLRVAVAADRRAAHGEA